jgi:signal transduction histidine kinase
LAVVAKVRRHEVELSSPHDPVAAAPSSRRIGGTLSIDWKLPLLITAVLAAGLAAFLAFTYFTLTRRSESVVRDRFASAARLVARSVNDAVDQRRKLTEAAVEAPELARVLSTTRAGARAVTSDSIAAAAVLSRLLTRDSLGVMLADADGRVVASAGKPLPAGAPVVDPLTIAPLSSDDAVGAVRFGPMMHVGDSTLFWVVGPVMAGTQRVGYVLEPRWVTGPPNALQMLRDLTREDLSLYLRNIDGSGWTYAPGRRAPAPVARDSTGSGVYYERPETGRMIAEETPVAGTPWLVVIDSPSRVLFSRLRTTIEQLAWMSLLLLAAGAAIAWAVSRRITRPIVALTSAANQVATGTYERPIPLTGADEIGQLTRRFHEMAEQVSEARRELEQRATDAQHVADELAGANRRLQTAMTEAQSARSEAERAKTEAEGANRAKGDFLAMMSHELRTPLNAIAGYAELIEMGIHGPVTDAQRDALNRIARSQAHLLTLINDVLNFARIDAGQITYVVKDVRMSETLGGLEPLVGPQVAARRLTFAYDGCDATIVAAADPDKVRQVVLNLLSNAVKYTAEGGTVHLSCDADLAVVRVHVRDTGPGIEAEQLPVIFEAFVQGHRALNRPNEGVGLGLAISRDLARGMGGDVTVATEIGVGSTFTLMLPRAGVKAAATLTPRGSATVA